MKLRDERGVALMLVFWMIIVLGAAAAALVAAVGSESGVVVNVRARARAEAAAQSGVAYATAELRRTAMEAASPQELAYLFPRLRHRLDEAGEIALGGGAERFQVAVIDLNARVDLNVANATTLQALFAQFTSVAQAEAIVAALQDWKDPDDDVRPGGAEAAEYATAGAPFLPTNRPLATVGELSHVRGVDDELAARVAPYVTVWGDGAIDVNAAPEPVLAALPGVGPDLARALVAQRTGAGLFHTFGEATSFLASGGTSGVGLVGVRAMVVPTRLLIVSRGWAAGHPLSREVQAAVELRGLAPGRTPQVFLRNWIELDR